MPEEEKENLENASRYYGIKQTDAHRALADALTAHLLYRNVKRSHFRRHRRRFDVNRWYIK